ncbi:GDSL-type esterase/lipase family protein [Peribacillus sp. SCS-155]|uniref:GDSL-type esterase/lipase family protein n=1 Tax=Peribacillus sedimenti TaxID=3115297 RepID=UPI0039064133
MKKIASILTAVILISLIWFIWHNQKEKQNPVIIALGDSLTNGVGDENGEGYLDLIEKQLDKNSNKNVSIWNYGIPGQETDGVLKQLEDERLNTKLDKADYFIVFIGTNDLINSNGGDLHPLHEQRIDKAKPEFKRNLTKILHTLEKKNKDAPILVLGLYNPFPAGNDIEKQIVDWDRTIKNTIEDDKRIVYIPTNDLFKHKEKQRYFSDELHPNENGYKLIANRILERYGFNM